MTTDRTLFDVLRRNEVDRKKDLLYWSTHRPVLHNNRGIKIMQRTMSNTKQLKRIFKEAQVDGIVKMLLVKDHGVYLIPFYDGQPIPSENDDVIYLKGFNPDKDYDWYENARNQLGGDDFGIQLDFSKKAVDVILNMKSQIIFKITDTSVSYKIRYTS